MLNKLHFKHYLLISLLSYSSSYTSCIEDTNLSSYKQLVQAILEVTHAKEDKRLDAIYRIEHNFFPQLVKQEPLKGFWNSLKNNFLKDPESFLNKHICRKEYEKNLLKKNSSAFECIYESLNQIETFRRQVATRADDMPALENFLDDALFIYLIQIENFYHQFIIDILSFEGSSAKLERLIESKVSMFGELDETCFFYRISQKMAHYLIGKDHLGRDLPRPIHQDTISNHRVTSLPKKDQKKIFFKLDGQPSLNPSKEFMVATFSQQLGIKVPASGLLFLDNILFENGWNEEVFVLLMSQAVEGMAGTRFLEKSDHLTINPESFSRSILGTLLTCPLDARPDNFIVSTIDQDLEWINIDNDEAFEAPLDFENNTVKLKSALFLFPQMAHLVDESCRTFFSTIVPDMFLLKWLKALTEQTSKYQTLYKKNLFYLNYRKGAARNQRFLDILWKDLNLSLPSFNKFTFSTLYKLIRKIKRELTQTGITHDHLFEVCYPHCYAHYQHIKETMDNPFEALLIKGSFPMLPLPVSEDLILKEKAYFTKTLLNTDLPMLTSDWLHKVKKRASDTLTDEVILSYLNQFDTSSTLSSSDFQEIVKDLELLIHYAFINTHQAEPARALWLLGRPHIYKAWTNIFQTFRTHNPQLHWLLTIEETFPQPWTHKERFPKHPLEIKGVFSGRRSVPSDMATKLFDSEKRLARDPTLTGRSFVNKYPSDNPLFYFKKHPEFAGYEYAATDFMRRMGIQGIPYNELFLFYHEEEGYYPVLLNQAIKGLPVLKIWDNDDAFSHLDPYHTGLLIVAAMLLNPEDGKEDNFILSPDGRYLIPIDNDHSFLPGTIRTQGSFLSLYKIYEKLQTKTLLFSLNEMQGFLHEDVVKTILSYDVDQFITAWLKNLVEINDSLQTLFREEMISSLWKGKDKRVCLKIPLCDSYVENLHFKFHLMQDLLKENNKMILIDLLENLEPYIAKRYRESFTSQESSTLKTRFIDVTKKLLPQSQEGSHRSSALNSQQMIEIIHMPVQEITGNPMHAKQSPQRKLDLLNRLIQHRKTQSQISFIATFDDPLNCSSPLLTSIEERKRIDSILAQKFPQTTLAIYYSQLLDGSFFKSIALQNSNKGERLRALDLRGAQKGNENLLRVIGENCSQLTYLNISTWSTLKMIQINQTQGQFAYLNRLIAHECSQLHSLNLTGSRLQRIEAQNNGRLKTLSLSLSSLDFLDLTDQIFLTDNLLSLINALSPAVSFKAFPSRLKRNQKNLAFYYDIGSLYYKGEKIKQDYKEAIKWYQIAADLNDSNAQNQLGYMYQSGFGVTQDTQEAIKWYQKAGNQNHTVAQNDLKDTDCQVPLSTPFNFDKNSKKFFEKIYPFLVQEIIPNDPNRDLSSVLSKIERGIKFLDWRFSQKELYLGPLAGVNFSIQIHSLGCNFYDEESSKRFKQFSSNGQEYLNSNKTIIMFFFLLFSPVLNGYNHEIETMDFSPVRSGLSIPLFDYDSTSFLTNVLSNYYPNLKRFDLGWFGKITPEGMNVFKEFSKTNSVKIIAESFI